MWLPHDRSLPYYFGLALNLCQRISSNTAVGQKCGSVSELQLQEPVDMCESDKQKRDLEMLLPYCWFIHQNSHPVRKLDDDSNPSRGAWILFGNLSCCPKNGINLSDPETIGQVPIWIRLEPPMNSDKCNDLDYFELDFSRTSDFRAIFGCPVPHEPFVISVLTSRLCPGNINYVLNPNQANLDCSVDEMNNVLTCIVMLALNDSSKTSNHVWFLNHFQVEVTRNTSVTSLLLSELAVNDSSSMPPISHYHRCRFSLPTKGLEVVAVKYSFEPFVGDGNIQHSPYQVVLHPSQDDHSETRQHLIVIIAVCVGILSAFLTIAIGCYNVYRRNYGSGNNNDNRDECSHESNNPTLVTDNDEGPFIEREPLVQSVSDVMLQNGLHPNCSGLGLNTGDCQPGRTEARLQERARSTSHHYTSNRETVIRDQLISKDRLDVYVIRHKDDAQWVNENLKPLFEQFCLSVGDCHSPRNETEVGQLLTKFIVERINVSSCYIIVCSPVNNWRMEDFSFDYSVAQALQGSVQKNSTGKLLIIATSDQAGTVPETLSIFTHIKWTDPVQQQLLRTTLQSICCPSSSS